MRILTILLLVALVSCKKEEVKPDCGTPHTITVVVEPFSAKDTSTLVKSVDLQYSEGCGAFTYTNTWSLAMGSEKLHKWDTTFTAYTGSKIKFTPVLNSKGISVYYVNDGDTSFQIQRSGEYTYTTNWDIK